MGLGNVMVGVGSNSKHPGKVKGSDCMCGRGLPAGEGGGRRAREF